MYANVSKMLGNCYLEANCFEIIDGQFMQQKLVCHVRGSLFKKDWIFVGSLILVSLRSFQNTQTVKTDVIHHYSEREAIGLKMNQHIPEKCK